MALLEASGIGKDFGETHVLKDISLTLEQGEALAIIGSSGSGKTTLLRCLNFLERPDTGVIKVNGETMWDAADPATQRESEVRKKRLHFGLVFQNFNLFPQYTALQNVMLAGELLAVIMTLGTLSFLVTTPEVWVPELGSGEYGFPLLSGAGRLVIKDTAILAGVVVLLSDTARKLLARRREA